MIIGVMGAKTSKSKYVGDFQIICAPLSSRSYTENWRFLHTKGAENRWYNSPLVGYNGWGYLSQKMHDVFHQDVNAPRGQMVRPIPMKLCPPNYLMNGISVKTDGIGITGIVTLECRKPINETTRQNADGPDQISIYLDADDAGVDGYTLYGKDYSLDQHIGNSSLSTPNDERRERISCGNYVFGGLQMTHNDSGEMVQFKPVCLPYEL